MKKKLLIPLFCWCLIFMTSCGQNKTVSGDADNVTLHPQAEGAPDSENTAESKDSTGDETAKQTDFTDLNESDVQTSTEENSPNDAASENTENVESDTNAKLVDGMRPEFKDAMDSYEAFYDEYCDVLKKYTENPSDMKLFADYTDMLTKAAEMAEKFDAWENDDLNSAELKYYLDVNNRVTQKLIDVLE